MRSVEGGGGRAAAGAAAGILFPPLQFCPLIYLPSELSAVSDYSRARVPVQTFPHVSRWDNF